MAARSTESFPILFGALRTAFRLSVVVFFVLSVLHTLTMMTDHYRNDKSNWALVLIWDVSDRDDWNAGVWTDGLALTFQLAAQHWYCIRLLSVDWLIYYQSVARFPTYTYRCVCERVCKHLGVSLFPYLALFLFISLFLSLPIYLHHFLASSLLTGTGAGRVVHGGTSTKSPPSETGQTRKHLPRLISLARKSVF